MTPRDIEGFLKRKGLGLLLAGIALAAVLYSVFGEMGLVATWNMRRTQQQLAEENARLRGEIERLRREVADLTTNPATVEEIARRDLGLMGKKENVIVLKPKKGTCPPGPAGGGEDRRR